MATTTEYFTDDLDPAIVLHATDAIAKRYAAYQLRWSDTAYVLVHDVGGAQIGEFFNAEDSRC